VPSTPGSARIELESNPFTLTGDRYSDRSLLGVERRYTIPERIACAGTGNFNSAILAPTGVRLLITGVSVEWAAAPAVAVTISLGVVLGGSALLGTADNGPGVFSASTPTIHLPAGTAAGTLVQAHPTPLNLVTREGTGGSLYRVTQVGADFASVVTVYFSPFSVTDLPC